MEDFFAFKYIHTHTPLVKEVCSCLIPWLKSLGPPCMEGRGIYIYIYIYNVIIIGMGGPYKGISNRLEEEKIPL